MLQALYGHVRAGQLEEAIDLCRKANQPWRAASIRGALLFQWRAIGELYSLLYPPCMSDAVPEYTANEPRDEDAMDDGDENASEEVWGHKGVQQRLSYSIPC